MGDIGTWVLRPRLWRKDGKLGLKNWIKQVMITGHGTQERDPMSLFKPVGVVSTKFIKLPSLALAHSASTLCGTLTTPRR